MKNFTFSRSHNSSSVQYRSSSAEPEKPSAQSEQPIDDVEETVEAPEAAQTQPPSFEEGEYIEIVEENEKEGCGTLHQCSETSVGVQCPAHEPNLNLKEVKEGGRDRRCRRYIQDCAGLDRVCWATS